MNRNTTVLLIDDEENYLFIIKEILTEEGYTVKTSNDPELALLWLEKEEFDIVITDVKMPKCSGKDVAEHVHKKYPHIPIIVITAFGSIENAISFMKGGVFHYLTKPFENEELLRAVHNASELVYARKQYQLLYNKVHGTKKHKGELIAHSKAMKPIAELIHSLSETTAPIIIEGECGTGKEYIARYIHAHSPNTKGEVCMVIAEKEDIKELEREIFGDAGTVQENTITMGKEEAIVHIQKDEQQALDSELLSTIGVGAMEKAIGGTLILRGVEHLPSTIQTKLALYISEQGTYGKALPRIIATSTIALEDAVKAGTFREDLYYYLGVLRLTIPPLRRRREDIPYLAVELMKEIAEQHNSSQKQFSEEVLQYFTNYEWFGNINEMQAIIKRIVVLTQEERIELRHLPAELQEEETRFSSAVDLLPISLNLADTLEKIEEQLIRRALVHSNFVQARAATLLGISKSRLQYKLMKYEISGHQLYY